MESKLYLIGQIIETEQKTDNRYHYNNRFDELYDLDFTDLTLIYMGTAKISDKSFVLE